MSRVRTSGENVNRAKSRPSRRGDGPAGPQSKSKSATPGNSDRASRNTGIGVLGDMPWGSHVCVFYETKEDLLDTAVAYFAAGLASNEFCVWAISDPVTESDAKQSLRRGIADFDRHLAAKRIEIVNGDDWYLSGDNVDSKRITGGWSEKLRGALAAGFAGMRVSGNAFWMKTKLWKNFCDYEQELDRGIAAQKILVMCTYSLRVSRAVELMDAMRRHQVTVTLRSGHWELLETPGLRRIKREIGRVNDALDVLSRPFLGHALLTGRERDMLTYIVRGASSKEVGRMLGVSPRTVEFHRLNIMRKIGAKNTVDLVRRVLE